MTLKERAFLWRLPSNLQKLNRSNDHNAAADLVVAAFLIDPDQYERAAKRIFGIGMGARVGKSNYGRNDAGQIVSLNTLRWSRSEPEESAPYPRDKKVSLQMAFETTAESILSIYKSITTGDFSDRISDSIRLQAQDRLREGVHALLDLLKITSNISEQSAAVSDRMDAVLSEILDRITKFNQTCSDCHAAFAELALSMTSDQRDIQRLLDGISWQADQLSALEKTLG